MVKLSVIETEKPGESLIIGRGTKDFAYRFRPYSRWPQGPQFKVFTTIAETQISVDECRVNDEGEVIFIVIGDIKDAKVFIKDWIAREGWKVENPLGEEESLAVRRWKLRAEAEKLVKEIREEKAKHGV